MALIVDLLEELTNTLKGETDSVRQQTIIESLQEIVDNVSATDATPGIVEFATDAECITGTATDRAVTPAGLTASGLAVVPDATTTTAGKVELATNAETQTGTDSTRAVTPAGLAACTGTESRAGVLELATTVEAAAGVDTARAVTAAGVAAYCPAAAADAAGKVELATDAETQTGTDATRAVTPASLAACTGTESRKGVLELATDAETQTGTDSARAITPANLAACTATATRKGVAELATDAEAKAGTDTARTVTPANVAAVLAGCKVGSFAGKNGAGACTLTGAVAGDIVIGVAGLTDMGIAASSFEAAITVNDQIQQSAVGDLSTKNFVVFLKAVV